MDPIDFMMNEHQKILQVLACLERLVWRADDSGRVDDVTAGEMIRFFREYADRTHHGKEEDIYFPALDGKGLSEAKTLSGDLVREHVEGRELVAAMEAVLPRAAEGDAGAVDEFARAASQFIFMLRRHIRKEDNFLFPVGDLSLNATEQAAVQRQFEEFDRKSESKIAELVVLADRLADAFGVSKDRLHFGESAS